MLAEIVWGAPEWTAPALVLAAVALAALVWGYWFAPGSPRIRLAAALLKTIAVLAIASCLLEPLLRGQRARPGANLFVVLADNSQSMQVRDEGSKVSRGEQLRAKLTDSSAWQEQLGRDFELRRYSFDTRLRALGDFSELSLDGTGSSLHSALRTLSARFRDRPLAGVLLMTDGNVAAVDLNEQQWSDLPPIYPVLVGEGAAPRDIGLARVTASQTNFEQAPVTIQAELVAHGYDGQQIAIQLLDETGEVVEQQTAKAPAHDRPLLARFQLSPDSAGMHFYRIRVSAENELEQFEAPNQSREATLGNNERLVAIDRAGGPYRVLYVSGRPNWEFKFLRRAMSADDEVELLGLVRIARREPKFDFRSRTGETTNPLFRGFGNQGDDTAEQYDQPVMIRLGTEDEFELREGFPTAPDQLFRYHGLILDDVEAGFFTADQMTLIRRFVGQRGGGLLMLGGQQSFDHGDYERTELAELMPVYLTDRPEEQSVKRYRMSLTREGLLQPWARLRSEESAEQERLDLMPPFQTFQRFNRIKPGAAVLAEASDPQGQTHPALVVQRYGKGSVGAILLGDLWRWGMHREETDRRDLETSWRQTLRWLVSDVPQRVQCDVLRPDESDASTVQLETLVYDADFQALDNAEVSVVITQPDGGEIKLMAEASEQKAGVYETLFSSRQSGAYRAVVSVTDPDGSEVNQRETGWTSQPEADEFATLQPNQTVLEQLAQSTGGEMTSLKSLDRFVAELPSRKAPITESWYSPLWHQPWMFLLAMVCLAAEVGLRRWKGLP